MKRCFLRRFKVSLRLGIMAARRGKRRVRYRHWQGFFFTMANENHFMRTAGFCCLMLSFASFGANAEHRQTQQDRELATNSKNCYDPGDATEIRLWEDRAPGAVGDDPCRDIPYLKMYRAPGDTAPTRTAIIVMPGGGYDRLSDCKEQAPVGEYFSQKLHVTTFVLFYRLVQKNGVYRYPIPMWDAQRAIKLVRYRSNQYGFDPNKLGVFGFSAGGHLATMMAVHSATDFKLDRHDVVDALNGRPNFLGLGYPIISMLPDEFASPNSLGHLLQGYEGRALVSLERHLSGQYNVTPHAPPTFLFESLDDAQISPQNSVLFAGALQEARVPHETHLFPHGKHGAGLASDIPQESEWPRMFHDWLVKSGYLP